MRKEKKGGAAQERRDALKVLHQARQQPKVKKQSPQSKQPAAAVQIQVGGHKSKQSSHSKQSVSSERHAALGQVSAYEAEAKRDLVDKLSARAKSEGLDLKDLDVDFSQLSLQQLQKLDARWQDVMHEDDQQKRNLSFLDVLKSFFMLQGYATKKLGDATVDTAIDIAGMLRSIIDALGQIAEILRSYAPALREIIDELSPALKQFNDLIVKPYLGLVKDTEATMQKFKEDVQAGRLDPDAITPPISGPWKDWKRVAAISTAVNLPLVGPVRKAMIGTVGMARYQAATGRGWPSEFEMLQWAAGQPGILGPAMSVADALPAGKIPLWFLKN